jgi:hypothetical protein
MKQSTNIGMRRMAHRAVRMIAVLSALTFSIIASQAADPLPSWNDGPAKQSIISFVEKVIPWRAQHPNLSPPRSAGSTLQDMRRAARVFVIKVGPSFKARMLRRSIVGSC